MKRPYFTTLVFFIFCLSIHAHAQQESNSEVENEKAAVQHLIESTYIEVLYNGNKDLSVLDKGFHAEFNMYVYYQNELYKSTLEEWKGKILQSREKMKNSKTKKQTTWDFRLIDVTGQTAMAVLEVFSDGKIKYTDYLTLYKIENEWKVMTKLFSTH